MITAFINDISPDYIEVVNRIHEDLTRMGCTVKLQQAKSGHVVSYNHPQTKKVLANFVSRRTGPMIRIYADHAAEYSDYLQEMPEKLEALLAKSSDCRRLLDPEKCNARCSMGYDLTIHGVRHQKCRFNCFLFPVNGEYAPYLQGLLEREMSGRSA